MIIPPMPTAATRALPATCVTIGLPTALELNEEAVALVAGEAKEMAEVEDGPLVNVIPAAAPVVEALATGTGLPKIPVGTVIP